MNSRHRVGIYMSEKKAQKFNWCSLRKHARKYNLDVFKVGDLHRRNLMSYGDMDVFLHKLTDVIAAAEDGSETSRSILVNIESYFVNHPKSIILDPVENIRRLLYRFKCYSIINDIEFASNKIYTPTFCEITSIDSEAVKVALAKANVSFPFICKPRLGHGSKDAHKMFIVFNENNLKDCEPNSVVQSFVNHDAVLYKIFVIGGDYHCVQRPSIKNLYPGDFEPIHFDSGEICKASSQSQLSILDDKPQQIKIPDALAVQSIIQGIRHKFQLDLIGIDYVIDNDSGKYAIIDINVFPGYDGFPNYYDTLFSFISERLPAIPAIPAQARCSAECTEYTKICDCSRKSSSTSITSRHDVINR